MLAKRIELVNVETARVGALQTFLELEIKNLKSQSLRLLDLARLGGDLDIEVRHADKKLAHG